MLAVILESGEPTRLYTALSVLVSTAAEGEDARGLISFGALPVLIEGRFERHLAELWATAEERVTFHACAAAVDAHGNAGRFEVLSTPRFLKETEGARFLVV